MILGGYLVLQECGLRKNVPNSFYQVGGANRKKVEDRKIPSEVELTVANEYGNRVIKKIRIK